GAATTALVSGATFLLAGALFNSRLGRLAEEALTDWLNRNWLWLSGDVLPGLFRFTMFFFKSATENLERLLYTVDEWLRFRTGDSQLSLVFKLGLGLVWFFLTYFIRVFINLFVEPTVNPIKHFPVVTVAAKLIVPIIPILFKLGVELLTP